MTSFSVIGIYVDDINKAVDFYCEKLGFEEVKRYNNDCIVQLKNNGPTVILEKTDNPSPAKYPEDSQVVLCIATDDIKETSEKLRTQGVEFLQEHPEEFVAGLFMVIRDPAGNTLQLLQFKEE
ncbi:MAG: VOC family protein [Candidatus Thorarchaeota archaeon]|nr:VOC family protein [Candidatus Thorarchaeota archaeon]